MALSSAAKVAVYILKLLREINIGSYKDVSVLSDNQSAIQLVKNPVYHSRSKHIDIKYHHIRDLYKSNCITLDYCSTTLNVADILTRNLCVNLHEKFVNLLEMKM